ncbi:hypothetical protein ACHAW6_008098 [Cyclotella cf. meneghiniana]
MPQTATTNANVFLAYGTTNGGPSCSLSLSTTLGLNMWTRNTLSIFVTPSKHTRTSPKIGRVTFTPASTSIGTTPNAPAVSPCITT